MTIKKNIIAVILLLCSGLGYSQNYFEDIGKIIKTLKSTEQYQITSRIQMYDNAGSKREVLSFDAKVISTQNGYRSQIGETEIISNEKMVVMIDHEDQMIQIENKQKIKRKDEKLLDEIQQLGKKDSVLTDAKLLSQKGHLKTYQLSLKGDIVRADVTLNMANNTIEKIEYHYDDILFPTGNYVVITYTSFKLKEPINKTVITGEDVFVRSGKKFTTTTAFNNYQIVNLYVD